jgi:hypothetical protein
MAGGLSAFAVGGGGAESGGGAVLNADVVSISGAGSGGVALVAASSTGRSIDTASLPKWVGPVVAGPRRPAW